MPRAGNDAWPFHNQDASYVVLSVQPPGDSRRWNRTGIAPPRRFRGRVVIHLSAPWSSPGSPERLLDWPNGSIPTDCIGDHRCDRPARCPGTHRSPTLYSIKRFTSRRLWQAVGRSARSSFSVKVFIRFNRELYSRLLCGDGKPAHHAPVVSQPDSVS